MIKRNSKETKLNKKKKKKSIIKIKLWFFKRILQNFARQLIHYSILLVVKSTITFFF